MRMITVITIFLALTMVFACCSSEQKATRTSVSESISSSAGPQQIAGAGHYRNSSPRGENAVMPKARIYRTNGDYRLNVPITLNASRTEIVSYPGPSDISMKMAPVILEDGWLLDRRGVGLNTAFTTYTYEEYAELPAPPSLDVLLKNVIKNARVTEVRELPMILSEAVADTAAVNAMIRENKF